MDEISKNIETKSLGIQISENKTVGYLLRLDDVVLIKDDATEMPEILDIYVLDITWIFNYQYS